MGHAMGGRRSSGQLEAEVLRALWTTTAPMTAAALRRALEPEPAITTVLTVLDRLVVKGEVLRIGRAARGVRFAAARTEPEHHSDAMRAVLGATVDRAGTLLRFAGALDDDEVEVLRRALDERRR